MWPDMPNATAAWWRRYLAKKSLADCVHRWNCLRASGISANSASREMMALRARLLGSPEHYQEVYK